MTWRSASPDLARGEYFIDENGEATRLKRLGDNPDSICYPGGKNLAGIWQWIIGKMPPHAYYAEPFAGSGGVLRRKPPALVSIAVDQDEEVIAWWKRLAWPGAIVICESALAWLSRMETQLCEDRQDWLIYCDPPYLPETRVKKKIYAHELTSDEHVELLRRLNRLDCRVMLSGYHSALYDQYLRRWLSFTREAITRGGTMRTEVLWCNFDPSQEHSLGMTLPAAGSNFRERERIKRKRKRWCDRFKSMGGAERRLVLAALIEADREAGTASPNQAMVDRPSSTTAIRPAASPKSPRAAAIAK